MAEFCGFPAIHVAANRVVRRGSAQGCRRGNSQKNRRGAARALRYPICVASGPAREAPRIGIRARWAPRWPLCGSMRHGGGGRGRQVG
jgi:hypothetical protein